MKEKGKNRRTEVIVLDEFISVKGFKALGNRLTNKKVKDIKKFVEVAHNKKVPRDVQEFFKEVRIVKV